MEKKSMENYSSPFFSFLLLFISLFFLKISGETDTITSTQSIRDGDTIVSSDGTFELGFFAPANSQNRYVGIWYRVTDKTPVWVANRDAPLKNKSGVLRFKPAGVLSLLDASNQTIWSTNSSGQSPKNPVAQLLKTGNLVVREADDETPENFIWQSFDYPSNTLLAGMKLGKNLVTGLEMFLSSWKTPDDPSPGEYTYHCDITGYPQDLLRKGSKVVYRAGLLEAKA